MRGSAIRISLYLKNSRGYRYESKWENADLLVILDAYQLQNQHAVNMLGYDLPELDSAANLAALLGEQLSEKIHTGFRVYPWGHF